MMGSAACLAAVVSVVRFLSTEIHVIEIAFFRTLFGIIFLLPWIGLRGFTTLKTRRWGLHFFRAASGLAALICLFTAIELIPLSEATALTFAAPLFAVAGSGLILGERVRAWRWVAVIAGFVGTLIILRPGSDAFTPGALFAVASALLAATVTLTVKSLSRTESPVTIVLYFNILVIPLSFALALFVWETPALHLWPWLILVGFLATAHQLLLTMALTVADASAILPFDFSQIIFVTVLGALFYSEIPDTFTVLGATIIVGSTALVFRLEGKAV